MSIKTSFTWDSVTNASYKIQIVWTGKYDWPQAKDFIDLLKQLVPSSDRDYDPESKTWYVLEKYVETLKTLAATIGKVEFTPKPEGQTQTSKFVPVDNDLETFTILASKAGVQVPEPKALRNLPLLEATKFYRKAALYLHPDRNPEGNIDMSSLNEVWQRLKTQQVFK